MSLHYADTSAWLKLVVDEAETEPMLDHLTAVQTAGGRFASSQLLATELLRAGGRLGVNAAGIDDALAEIDLVLPTAQTYRLAGRLPGASLRSLDALHLATALETGADAFVTYDLRQADAAIDAGLRVVAPGT
ncbi:type II toxin-antitoxin system VapC family toxin [Aeromicrobium fastidiosum]|uniref:Ribonuclease VapC n=1 Tax=Aeromicrobium fastidiosum TaxID=52699 RepID=A0A641AQ82_9ACTN|nr:type II toxin-antitoxin system VapC family toxin [Aeromicrobium fastidiosum]KAA1380266.1 type II toxin-antitoxin system VapC family toxin [Aeromicrobium fastidiosum]MBP2389818.1 putative nucleic acid-binding protein [Aeromicrobium fastidiosum]